MDLLKNNFRDIWCIGHQKICKYEICEQLKYIVWESWFVVGDRTGKLTSNPAVDKVSCRSIIPSEDQKERAQLSRTKSIRSPRKDWRWFQITSWSSFKMNCFRAACASLPTDCKWRMSSSERWVSSDKSWSVISTPCYRWEISSYCRISPEDGDVWENFNEMWSRNNSP